MQFPNLERQNLIVRPAWKFSSSTLLLPGLIKLNTGLRRQLIEQRLRLFQITRLEPLSEPPVNRSQQFASIADQLPNKNGGSLTTLFRGLVVSSPCVIRQESFVYG
jgi:hypothetical protein